MIASVIAILLNLVLNYVLIFGHFGFPRMGVAGAALATVISRYVEMVYVLVHAHRHPEKYHFLHGAYRSLHIDGGLLKKIAVTGTPLMLNEVRNQAFKRVVQTLTYMPHFISTVILVSMITSVVSPSTGLLGYIAKLFGMKPYYFLGDPNWFRPINVISGIWQTTGWNSIVFLASISSIDPSLYEAATVDGAGRLRRIWHVTLPGIRNTILILLILRIGNMLGSNFEKVYLLQNDLNLSVSETLSTYVYKMGMTKSKYGFSTAVGLFESIVSLILVVAANIASKKLSNDDEVGIM